MQLGKMQGILLVLRFLPYRDVWKTLWMKWTVLLFAIGIITRHVH